MIVIIGSVVVLGAVLVGFMWSGGHVGALLHPAELLIIGGAALGTLVVMSPWKVLVDVMHGALAAIKGSPFDKQMYRDLFKMSYELLRIGRRDGLLALEPHIEDPHQSAIFGKYPRILHHHHVVEFLCSGLAPIIEGAVNLEQMESLLDGELEVLHEEHHAPIAVLSKTADALPGFGIVAAVLGIVITMGAIDGPVEEVGHKVGAALVGTFLGILLSYGFLSPLATKMEFLAASELAFFRTVSVVILGAIDDCNPKVTLERARRRVGADVRPKREEMDELFKEADAA